MCLHMKIKLLLPLSIFFMIFTTSYSQEDGFSNISSTDVVKERLIEHSESTNSIESNFIQEKHLWMLNEVIVSEGIFLFKKDNSVRWQYNTPIEYTIIIHKGKFTIINSDKISEFDIDSNPMFKEINKMIVTAIRGDFINNPDFSAIFKESDNQYLVELSPTNARVSNMLTSINIYFDKSSMQVEKVIFKEPGDDFTSIRFKNKKINTEIPDSKFISSSK